MRLPSQMTLAEIQAALQDIHNVLRPLQATNPVLHGRRFQTGGKSVAGFDFVTKIELDDAIKGVEAGGTTTIVNTLEGPLTAPLDDHAPQHENGGLDEIDVTGLVGTVGGAGSVRIAGGVAGNHTVTGIATNDVLIAVLHIQKVWEHEFSGRGDGNSQGPVDTTGLVDIQVITSEFTITGADTINNAGGTNTSFDDLIVLWLDMN